jgi:hypothetical protein
MLYAVAVAVHHDVYVFYVPTSLPKYPTDQGCGRDWWLLSWTEQKLATDFEFRGRELQIVGGRKTSWRQNGDGQTN